MSETANERARNTGRLRVRTRWPRRARMMCKRLGDVPPAGRDTHVYYFGHGAAVVLPGKIGSRRRRRRRRHRRGRLVQLCAAHRDETRADTTIAVTVWRFMYYIIIHLRSVYLLNIIPSTQ